ncbi:MAG: metallophosphoesterase [Planctomycetota bacterium]|nr:metallophosphoesterase [Planctomycetota bacterium]
MSAVLASLLDHPVLLGAALIALLWFSISCLVQWGALRAARLAKRAAPPCFRAEGPGPGERVHVAFLGDLQRGVLDVPRALAPALESGGADLLVSSGDFVSHGEGPYYGVLLGAFARAGIKTPTRVVPGNHDLWPRRCKDDRIGGEAFERAFGPRHWSLRAGPVLIVGLDNGADWLIDDQLPWLERTLDEHAGVPWICVCHRPPYELDAPDTPPVRDMVELAALLERRKPLLVVAGHLHEYRDELVNGVRVIVNAHGGDVHGLALQRDDFELLHVRVGPEGTEVEPRPYRRRKDPHTALDQLAVRFWADRRKWWGALLGLPADLLLRLLGRSVPIVKHPVERRIPAREVLVSRRREALETR